MEALTQQVLSPLGEIKHVCMPQVREFGSHYPSKYVLEPSISYRLFLTHTHARTHTRAHTHTLTFMGEKEDPAFGARRGC